jgi:putative transposase
MDLYHLCNRGVDKRDVFMDDGDRVRFVHDLYVLNDREAQPNHGRDEPLAILSEKIAREQLVHIYAWALMPNHYHLLVSAVNDDPVNISLFVQKLGMGYSKFFNDKYKRTGALWQGKYRKVQIQQDAHFLYIPFYIHLNPLDLVMPEWRQGAVQDARAAITYLDAYRWSSFSDYRGIINFPSIIERPLLADVLGSVSRQDKILRDIISEAPLASQSLGIEMK